MSSFAALPRQANPESSQSLKKIPAMKSFVVYALIGLLGLSSSHALAQSSAKVPDSFRFVFLTDIHITHSNQAVEGFKQAISTANNLHPDFVITGGDLVMDALGTPFAKSDSLYRLYIETCKDFAIPVHNTIGNHEHFGVYKESGATPEHPDYGCKMFKRYLGPTYYSFNHKGWHFMMLNFIGIIPNRGYIGLVDKAQMEWIRNDLAQVADSTPIVVSTHIPLRSLYTAALEGNMAANDSATVVSNANEVLKLFVGHNLKLVLQGHQHFFEDLSYQLDGQTLRFITGGAVSSAWWGGLERGLQEGFVLVDIQGHDFKTRYVDYGWDATLEKK